MNGSSTSAFNLTSFDGWIGNLTKTEAIALASIGAGVSLFCGMAFLCVLCISICSFATMKAPPVLITEDKKERKTKKGKKLKKKKKVAFASDVEEAVVVYEDKK